MKNRRVTLIVAVVLAIATGILTLRYLSTLNKASQAVPVAMAPVVVASVNIPPRTKIRANMLAKVMRPSLTLEPGSISDPKDAEGDVALLAIPQGSPVTTAKVGVPASIGVTGRLKPGQRAVSIPVDMVKSVSGLIQPGDHVDVMSSTAALGTHLARTAAIIRGAIILAVNQSIDPNAPASPAPGAAPGAAPPVGAPAEVTLAVSAEQADLLATADLNTTLRLALRSPDEPAGSLPAQPLGLYLAPAAVAAPASAATPAAKPPAATPPLEPASTGVTFIDGDKTAIIAR